jgi:hypothetical protein
MCQANPNILLFKTLTWRAAGIGRCSREQLAVTWSPTTWRQETRGHKVAVECLLCDVTTWSAPTSCFKYLNVHSSPWGAESPVFKMRKWRGGKPLVFERGSRSRKYAARRAATGVGEMLEQWACSLAPQVHFCTDLTTFKFLRIISCKRFNFVGLRKKSNHFTSIN